jgi:hypothetical protein
MALGPNEQTRTHPNEALHHVNGGSLLGHAAWL